MNDGLKEWFYHVSQIVGITVNPKSIYGNTSDRECRVLRDRIKNKVLLMAKELKMKTPENLDEA